MEFEEPDDYEENDGFDNEGDCYDEDDICRDELGREIDPYDD